MKKQYLVMAQHAYQVEDKRWQVVFANRYGHGEAARYFTRKADAEKGLREYLAEWNKPHTYGANGERVETHAIGGGFAADVVSTKETDDDMRVVRWKIRVRQVTEWEEVASKEIK